MDLECLVCESVIRSRGLTRARDAPHPARRQRQHRKPAADVRLLQQRQRRSAAGVLGGEAAGAGDRNVKHAPGKSGLVKLGMELVYRRLAVFAQFSEFSYGFAFTHEYVNHRPDLIAAPELPSLVKEAQKGWDLKVGFSGHAKYFQFKLSEYMVRERARHWKKYNAPHYRVRITSPSQSDQHNLLKRLSEEGEEVHYVAPKLKPRWDVHLQGVGNQAVCCGGDLRPWIAVRSGSAS